MMPKQTPAQILDLVENAVTASLNELMATGVAAAAQPLKDFFASVQANPTQLNLVSQAVLLTVKFPLILPTLETAAIQDFAKNGATLLDELIALSPAETPTEVSSPTNVK